MALTDPVYPWAPLEEVGQPPYHRWGSCPLHDMAGLAYSWERVCRWPFTYTGQIIVKRGSEIVGIGNGVRVSQEHVLTAASVLTVAREVEGAEVWFVAPAVPGERIGVKRKITRWSQPVRGAVFDACDSEDRMVSQDSSDIAVGWLEGLTSEALLREDTIVLPGECPSARDVREANTSRNPIEALIVSSWLNDDAGFPVYSLHAMRSILVSVPVSGSVVIASVQHTIGERPLAPFHGSSDLAYSPLFDAGAPVVIVGADLKPKLIGIVSCTMEDPGRGVVYRSTRVDRWAGWLRSQVEPEPTGTPLPVPLPTPAPSDDGQPPEPSPVARSGRGAAGGVSREWVVAGLIGAGLLVGGWALGR